MQRMFRLFLTGTGHRKKPPYASIGPTRPAAAGPTPCDSFLSGGVPWPDTPPLTPHLAELGPHKVAIISRILAIYEIVDAATKRCGSRSGRPTSSGVNS